MDESQRFLQIKHKLEELSNQKIRIEERYKTEKQNLEQLLKEITDKGYDPMKLAEIREKLQKDLQSRMDGIEEEIKEVSTKIEEIEV